MKGELFLGHYGTSEFRLPLDAVTQTFAVLAKKGAGKTYLAGVTEEELAKHRIPFVVIDSMSAHYGIKEKYPVVVFGGPSADVPISPDIGAEIAEAILGEGFSAILDLSQESRAAQRQFVADFTEMLFARNRSPRHVFLEEVSEFCPQRVGPDFARVTGAIDTVVRLGRGKGLGCTLISQRSAVVNKDILSQIDTLFMLRTTWQTDVDVFVDLIKRTVTADDLEEFRRTIQKLPTGHAWFWSPEWLQMFGRLKVRERDTFHAGTTPKVGELRKLSVVRVDAAALTERFKDLIQQRTEEKDRVRTLEREVTRLRTQLDKAEQEADLTASLQKALKAVAKEGATPARIKEVVTPELQDALVRKDAEIARLQAAQAALAEDLRRAQAETERLKGRMKGAALVVEGLQLLGVGPQDAGSLQGGGGGGPLDEDRIVEKLLARIPTSGSPIVLQPPEALRKRYQQQEVDRLMETISGLSDRQRRMLSWLEAYAQPASIVELAARLGTDISRSGAARAEWSKDMSVLVNHGFVYKHPGKKGFKAKLRKKIDDDLAYYRATPDEGEQVYQAIIHRLAQ